MQLYSNQESNSFSSLFWERFPIQGDHIQHGLIYGIEKRNVEHKRIMLSILNHYITERGIQNDSQANDLLFFDYIGDVAPFVEQATSLLNLKPQLITSPISSDVDVYQGIQSAIGNGTLLFYSTHLREEYKDRMPFISSVQYCFLQMVIRLHEMTFEIASVNRIGEFILALKNGNMQPIENLLEVLHTLHGELSLIDDIESLPNEKKLLASTLKYFNAEVYTALAVCHEVFNVVEKILENERYLKVDKKYNYFFFDHVSGIDRHPFIVEASVTSQIAVANQYLATFITNILDTPKSKNDKELQGVTYLFIRLESLEDILKDKELNQLLNRAVNVGAVNSLQIWFITNDESLHQIEKEIPILLNVRNRYNLSTHEGV
ncbi:hypothetical protein ABD87_22975 [Lysinibacillus sphaericus]|uniref:hypothetical protein n=1 Tax=Lysinibacillus sphaericus TaxID=1421 RepID=UPI0018CDE16C|nr:hypothetical protein [Lysinibacillus sphaericus]MBG9732290.1 hypothetical protein [Lysinibacillus sphaericus]